MDYEQPTKYLVHSTNYNGNEFDIPVLTAGKTFILGYTKETNYFDKEEIILFDDFTTDMKLVKFRFMLKSSAAKILKIKNKSNNITYIYNLLIKNRPERIGHNRHWISYTSQEYRFICNINEQSKIAKFLSLLDKQIELYVSKLALTEKIMDYYSKIFTKYNDLVSLVDNCEITTGKINANQANANGLYNFYTCGREILKTNNFLFDCEAILISGNGSNVGIVNYYKGKFNAYQRTYILKSFSENIFTKFIYYYLLKIIPKLIKPMRSESNIPYITIDFFKNIMIPNIKYEKQIQITIFFEKLDAHTKLIESKIKLLGLIRKFYLKHLFI